MVRKSGFLSVERHDGAHRSSRRAFSAEREPLAVEIRLSRGSRLSPRDESVESNSLRSLRPPSWMINFAEDERRITNRSQRPLLTPNARTRDDDDTQTTQTRQTFSQHLIKRYQLCMPLFFFYSNTLKVTYNSMYIFIYIYAV